MLFRSEAAKPIKTARVEVARAVETFRFAAVEARSLTGETIPMDAHPAGTGKFGFTLRVPVGVIGAISPFNFPLNLVAHKLAPAIAADCPVVLKPASQTPLTAILLAETIHAAGLPPERLELEISEAYIMRRAERDLRQLARLRELGVSLAVDDFGSGQSSLGYLQRLPVSRLKVDRGFLTTVGHDSGGATITRAIIGLGHGLGLTVVAEGVETLAQEAFLRQHGCDAVQGFHYSAPVDAATFPVTAHQGPGSPGR